MALLQKRRTTDLIVVHCAATKATMDIGAADIDIWHRQKGYNSIGYHFVIRRNGLVEAARDVETVGAHSKGFNSSSIGICLAGGIDAKGKPENNFTPEQFAALKDLLKSLKATYKGVKIVGHRDLPGVAKACPSFDVRAWLASTK